MKATGDRVPGYDDEKFRLAAVRTAALSIIAVAVAAVIAAGSSATAGAAEPSAPVVTALVGGTVVAIDGGSPIEDATVLIAGERITQVGPSASTPVPAGAKVIAMTGRWLIPGLMNTHVHLGLKLPGAAGDSLATETDTQEVLRMAGNARLSLLSGVTTLRLVGEDHGTDFALRSAIDRGEVLGRASRRPEKSSYRPAATARWKPTARMDLHTWCGNRSKAAPTGSR